MASTNFVTGTVIASTWLNAVNNAVYNVLPNLAPLSNPIFTTPSLGMATATSINKITLTPAATGATLTITDGKTLRINSTVTIGGADNTTLTVPANASVQGTNTGDQPNFTAYKVSGQVDVVPATTTDNLTFVAGTGITLTTDNTAKSITINSPAVAPGASILLAQYTISTSVASLNFLTVFSSAYDTYTIEIEGLATNSGTPFNIQLAKAGVAETGNYVSPMGDGGTGTGTTLLSFSGSIGVGSSALSALLRITNVNSTSTLKVVSVMGMASTPIIRVGGYTGTNAVTGFQIVGNGGGNFIAGTVRVYGVKNT